MAMRKRRPLLIIRPPVRRAEPRARPILKYGEDYDPDVHDLPEPTVALPASYRAYERGVDRFLLAFPWLVFGGLGAMVTADVAGWTHERPWLVDAIAIVTIWPALFGWMLTTGVGIVWLLLLARGRDRRGEGRSDAMFLFTWWLAGAMFIIGPIVMAASIAARLLG